MHSLLVFAGIFAAAGVLAAPSISDQQRKEFANRVRTNDSNLYFVAFDSAESQLKTPPESRDRGRRSTEDSTGDDNDDEGTHGADNEQSNDAGMVGDFEPNDTQNIGKRYRRDIKAVTKENYKRDEEPKDSYDYGTAPMANSSSEQEIEDDDFEDWSY